MGRKKIGVLNHQQILKEINKQKLTDANTTDEIPINKVNRLPETIQTESKILDISERDDVDSLTQMMAAVSVDKNCNEIEEHLNLAG